MKQHFIRGLYLGCGIALSLIAIFSLFGFILKLLGFYDRLDYFYNKYIISGVEKVSTNEEDLLHKLLQNKIIISPSEIFTHTLGYYDILITFLIGILGLVGVIAFFYIRGSSEEKAKEYAKKSTEEYFKTLEFDKKIKDKIDSVFDSGYGESFEGIFTKLEKQDKFSKSIDERLRSLEESNKEIKESNS